MKRVFLKIAYDGTAYNGWQTGGTGLSIADVIQNAISKLLDTDVKLIAASRTDAGVHAEGNVAIFDTDRDVNCDKISFAINNLLPDDIAVVKSFEVPIDFNPRKTETLKTYEYRIYDAKIRNPLVDRYTHFVYYDIDIDRMIEASKYLIGEHDFRSFANPESQVLQNGGSSIRNIKSIDIFREENNIIVIRVVGNGFLYHMVRIIAGTLLKIGMKMWEPEYIKEIMDKKDRKYAGFTLPAKGLKLIHIDFTEWSL